MRPLQLSKILISVIGIYFIAQGFVGLSALFTMIINKGSIVGKHESWILVNSFTTFCYASIGGILIYFRDRLSKYILGKEEEGDSKIDYDVIQAIGFSIVGVYFALQGTTRLIPNVVMYRNYDGWLLGEMGFWELILGTFLFFGSRGLVGLWNFLRRPKTTRNETDKLKEK